MNNRLSIPEIAGLLAEYAGVEKKKAERFIREFTLLVREVVFQDKILKIKGLGTFKIIEVLDRESVDVNTGKRIVIPGHYKFSFTPDKELKEAVNKPFSFFETVEISDHIDSSVFEQPESETEEPAIETSIPENTEELSQQPPVEEPAPEKEIIIEDPEENKNEEPEQEEIRIEQEKEEDTEPEITDELLQESPVEEPVTEKEIIIEEPEENNDKAPELEESEPGREEHVEPEIIDESPKETPVAEEPVEDNKEEDMRPGFFIPKVESTQNLSVTSSETPVKKKRIWMMVAVTVVILLVGAGTTFLFLNRNPLKAWNNQESDISVAADSIADNVINEMMLEPKEEVEDEIEITEFIADNEDTASSDDNSGEQEKVMATVKIKDGNRLTLIALEYYGNKVFWVYLYEYNKDLIKDPNNVPIGTEIKVPNPELYNINPNSKASLEKAALLQSQILLAL